MINEKFEQFALRLRDRDNVAVAKRPIVGGTELVNGSVHVMAGSEVPLGHKIAIRAIEPSEPIVKYGQIIGYAKRRIEPGEHVHTHNVGMRADADERMKTGYEAEYCADYKPLRLYSPEKQRTFSGFAREGGKVGTRNYVGVISSVNCSASVSRYVADRFKGDDFKRDFPNVDGVVPVTHKGGSGD